jgi:hypothetical protein
MSGLKKVFGSARVWTAIGTVVSAVVVSYGLKPEVADHISTLITVVGGIVVAALTARDAGK